MQKLPGLLKSQTMTSRFCTFFFLKKASYKYSPVPREGTIQGVNTRSQASLEATIHWRHTPYTIPWRQTPQARDKRKHVSSVDWRSSVWLESGV